MPPAGMGERVERCGGVGGLVARGHLPCGGAHGAQNGELLQPGGTFGASEEVRPDLTCGT